jgi:hypothetical protein
MSNSPGSSGTVVPAEVSALISESQTIQGWLDRLAGHQSDADPDVFNRVQSDYQGRLDKVTSKLVQHRSQLVSSLEARQAEVESLQGDRDTQAGHLEEARLRHAVGEFSDTQWGDASGNIEGSLAELDELLEMEAGAVSELAVIIDSIGEGGTPPASSEGDDATDHAADHVEDTDEELEDDTETAVVAGDPNLDADEDLADTDTVEITVEAGDDGPTAVVPEPAKSDKASATEEGTDPDAEGGEYLDELEFLESLSLDESDRFDAVSAMLDEDEAKKDK